ncbi:MAG TPA: Crp/Fnr family transcriptional regulator [Thermoanaerobaculia bacterium]|nr:Crp/Fnr family transcriptional regulator [Thermoanaerobaculia bacterium]
MTNRRAQDAPRGNRLLGSLTAEALERLQPEVFETRLGEVIAEAGAVASHVLFPWRGTMISVIRTDQEGTSVEVGVVGGEGAAPLHSALASLPPGSECMIQVAGPITRLRREAVQEAFASDEAFRNAVVLFMSVYVDQISQNAICNRLHPLEGRLAKWLLTSRQYTGKETLSLTHDFMSHMLGVRRPGVTIAVNALALDGLIEHTRGAIIITDHEGLELRACECHVVLRAGWKRVMGELR